jgi:hypothetical protein
VKEPVDHVLRPSLPWRSAADPAITECGYDAAKVTTLPREQFFARLKDYGPQRSALLTCMTCSSTAMRWGTWADDPRLAVSREVEWEGARWSGFGAHEKRGHRLKEELLAIEALIGAHPEEFRKLLAAIAARQEWRDRKAKNERAP